MNADEQTLGVSLFAASEPVAEIDRWRYALKRRFAVILAVVSVFALAGCADLFVDRGKFDSLAADEAQMSEQLVTWVESALGELDGVVVDLSDRQCDPTQMRATGVEVQASVVDGQQAARDLVAWLVEVEGAKNVSETEGTIATVTQILFDVDGEDFRVDGRSDSLTIRGGTGCYDE